MTRKITSEFLIQGKFKSLAQEGMPVGIKAVAKGRVRLVLSVSVEGDDSATASGKLVFEWANTAGKPQQPALFLRDRPLGFLGFTWISKLPEREPMCELVFLGTGAAVPSRDDLRHDTATWLSYGKHCNILVDCGEGVKYNLLRANLSHRVHHIFLTHDHYDHIVGLTGLLAMMSLRAQEPAAVTIYGPPPALERAEILAKLVRSRPDAPMGVNVSYHALEADDSVELGPVNVRTFATAHREKLSLGFVFDQVNGDSHKVVFTGDTRYLPALVDVAHGADWLVVNANFAQDRAEDAEQYGHMTAVQAAKLAQDAEVKHLFIQHVSPRCANNLKAVLAEATRMFEETYLAEDLSTPEHLMSTAQGCE
jgi:ribonuclease Z